MMIDRLTSHPARRWHLPEEVNRLMRRFDAMRIHRVITQLPVVDYHTTVCVFALALPDGLITDMVTAGFRPAGFGRWRWTGTGAPIEQA